MKTNEQSRRQAAALRWVVRIFMILVTVIMIYPLLWNVYSSFKTNNEFLTNAFSLPKSLAWDNYARAIHQSAVLPSPSHDFAHPCNPTPFKKLFKIPIVG
jgi:N-acetylglucosamine transport system permease protein